jgi:hypothetical protein
MLIAQRVGCQLSDRVSCDAMAKAGVLYRAAEEMGVASNTAHYPRIALGVGWEQNEGQNSHLGNPSTVHHYT